ncbi:hypothetical protein Plhal304r1_c022g0078311 [Plasmopara halstedii]
MVSKMWVVVMSGCRVKMLLNNYERVRKDGLYSPKVKLSICRRGQDFVACDVFKNQHFPHYVRVRSGEFEIKEHLLFKRTLAVQLQIIVTQLVSAFSTVRDRKTACV